MSMETELQPVSDNLTQLPVNKYVSLLKGMQIEGRADLHKSKKPFTESNCVGMRCHISKWQLTLGKIKEITVKVQFLVHAF